MWLTIDCPAWLAHSQIIGFISDLHSSKINAWKKKKKMDKIILDVDMHTSGLFSNTVAPPPL